MKTYKQKQRFESNKFGREPSKPEKRIRYRTDYFKTMDEIVDIDSLWVGSVYTVPISGWLTSFYESAYQSAISLQPRYKNKKRFIPYEET